MQLVCIWIWLHQSLLCCTCLYGMRNIIVKAQYRLHWGAVTRYDHLGLGLYAALATVGKDAYEPLCFHVYMFRTFEWSSIWISHKVENSCVCCLVVLCEGFHKWLGWQSIMCVGGPSGVLADNATRREHHIVWPGLEPSH